MDETNRLHLSLSLRLLLPLLLFPLLILSTVITLSPTLDLSPSPSTTGTLEGRKRKENKGGLIQFQGLKRVNNSNIIIIVF
jgi:hypothetical protein